MCFYLSIYFLLFNFHLLFITQLCLIKFITGIVGTVLARKESGFVEGTKQSSVKCWLQIRTCCDNFP